MHGRNAGAGLLVLRLITGWIFLWHGLGKLVGSPFPGRGMEAFAGSLESLGFPVPMFWAAVGMLVEAGGGLLLILGWQSTIASSLIIVQMLVAIAKAHFVNGVFGRGGWEFNLALCAALMCLLLAGPGAASLDRAKRSPASAP